MYVCMYVCMYGCMYVCMYCMYVLYVCMYACMYVHINSFYGQPPLSKGQPRSPVYFSKGHREPWRQTGSLSLAKYPAVSELPTLDSKPKPKP